MSELDLRTPTQIHVVGIGGAGMSAIATVLKAMGHEVSGSDLKEGPALSRLRGLGIVTFTGHSAEHLRSARAVAISTAIPETNVELAAARDANLPVLRRSEVLRAITKLRRTVAVSGTHGKTTTSSMLAIILTEAEVNASYVIGGEVNEIGTNANWGTGDHLVVEADESDGTFLELSYEIAVVTSVEPDHLDFYGSESALREAFRRFMEVAGERTVVCIDDPTARDLAPANALTYGFDDAARLKISGFGGGRSNISFKLALDGQDLGQFELPLPGVHNARNAAAAVGAAVLVGVPIDVAHRALARFAGVARRFEFRGERGGVTFVDDYAHLPGEVRAALAAARRGGWSRIVCVFQPHRFTRTATIGAQFAQAFDDADLVIITDIYPAGERSQPGISAQLIVDAIHANVDAPPVEFLARRPEVVEFLVTNLRPGDCCLTLGAGDLTTLPDEMLATAPW